MIIKHCITCDKPITVFPCQEERKKNCSRKCDFLWRKNSGMYAGANNPAYKGGIAIYENSAGKSYKFVLGKKGKIYEHRYVMEQYLGRSLNQGEEVHHINGDTLDNRPENLYVIDKKNHSRLHFQLFMKIQKLEQENERLKKIIASYKQSSFLLT